MSEKTNKDLDNKPEKLDKPENKEVKSSRAIQEEAILSFWQKEKIFEKTLDRKGKDWVFYDGPPFATGMPHYGHILAGMIKDVIPRYMTMKGYRVPRKWGWDCHGLPVENLIEKELELKTKKEIEEYGIERFNEAAKASVLRYADEWKKIVPRMGRWVDMENDYKTMDPTYMESVMSVFKSLYDKGLVYEGFKSMHVCPRCETSLSNFEVNQGYIDITDISVYVKFEIADGGEGVKTYFIAWTTTPWTLPGNVALAISEKLKYIKVSIDGLDGIPKANYILAKDRLEYLKGVLKSGVKVEILSEIDAKDLIGKSYKPVFDYYNNKDTKNVENGFKVYGAEFVTAEDGTGIVHIAPAFGEDDMNLGKEKNLPFIQHVSMDGRFKKEVKDFAGQSVKPKDDHQKTDIEIIKYLAGKGTLLAKEKLIHSYPHCWRCDTPLLNYATSSWFVKVSDEELKKNLLKENEKINWYPEGVGSGRFGKWLEGARDWAISRSRFWGAPIPVWRCKECAKIEVLGKLDDIKAKFPAKNEYIVMRHGEAEYNLKDLISDDPRIDDPLTNNGRDGVKKAIPKLKKEGVNLIITSPMLRAKQTAEIVREGMGLGEDKVIVADGIHEIHTNGFSNKPWSDYRAQFDHKDWGWIYGSKNNSESLESVIARTFSVIKNLEEKYSGQKILIVTHGAIERAIFHLANGEKYSDLVKNMLPFATPVKFIWTNVPRNKKGEIDFHRPFIDTLVYKCDCGGEMRRVSDVFDCWFESGSVPYGQNHYLCAPTENFDPKENLAYPSEFIAEGLDQTRGWFYTMHVLGVALFGKASYKKVIVNGMILAEDGKKMSKRLNNYPDPMSVANKYGVDAMRYYLLSSPVVSAEEFNFSEKGVDEVSKKIITRVYSVYSFIEMYGGLTLDKKVKSKNILDKWLMARLAELNLAVTSGLNDLALDRASRPVAEFVEDLSNWYLRRSRDRLRGDNEKDRLEAMSTLKSVLFEFTKIIAPLMPFMAEDLFLKLKDKDDSIESVHLTEWPKGTPSSADLKLTTDMKKVREVVELGHFARQESKINVRQPLSEVIISDKTISDKFIDILQDELNVKKVTSGEVIKADNLIIKEGRGISLSLNIEISPELKEEGKAREILRMIQDERKKTGLIPSDKITVTVGDITSKELIERFATGMMKVANIQSINVVEGNTLTIKRI